MPKYPGSCGCYNREMAQEFGVIAAIIYNDIEDKFDYYEREGDLQDGYFYLSQTNRADALVIPRRTYCREVAKLEEAGLIKKKVGYKPGSTTKVTWVKLVRDDTICPISLCQNDQSRLCQNDQSILYETKERDSSGVRVVYLRVNPSGRAWKSQRVYSTEEEVDRLESMDGEDYIDFKHWKSPKFVGDDSRAKFKRMKVKLVQPDVEEEEEKPERVNLWQ